ncbi:hypothetical protein K505DRAFT_420861 [Melanomma pulvis-pyrius CBS 109.77]|uniref:Secreted protein n=1 Tax=Melanomma pulvis-pyrius CBS 109.77 TaxID=1314802 RepID=A0A6A6WXZ6_9PLEO|nr:hypothetical protein K505DRAFT_420861 [Melanomma pulvis-pyrius CBS 109.77]
MRPTNILLAIAASASAADLRHYENYNCGGGFAACTNVGAGACCIMPNGWDGSASVAVVYTNPSTQLFGYQRTRNGDYCGSIQFQRSTGEWSFGCLSYEPLGAGRFAGTRWFPPGLLKREACSATATEKCTEAVTPDQVALKDGRVFGLGGVDEKTKAEWYRFLANGSTTADLPESFAKLEMEGEKVDSILG